MLRMKKVLKGIIRGLDHIVNFTALSLILAAMFLSGYMLWDSHQVYQTADAKNYEAYIPTEKNTKSFEEFIGLKNSAYVDINNCPFAPQLLNRGFAKDTGLYKESGFCSYPLWTFDETVLKETGGEKYERYARAYDEYMESSFIGMMGAEDETGEEICTGMMM